VRRLLLGTDPAASLACCKVISGHAAIICLAPATSFVNGVRRMLFD